MKRKHNLGIGLSDLAKMGLTVKPIYDTPASRYSEEGQRRLRTVYNIHLSLAKDDVRAVQDYDNLPDKLFDKLDRVYIVLNNIQELLSDPRCNI